MQSVTSDACANVSLYHTYTIVYHSIPEYTIVAHLSAVNSQVASHDRYMTVTLPRWRHYALSRGWMHMYTMEDNATCVHPPKPGARLSRPGWGGAYAGSKPRCYASHDMGPKAQPEACSFDKPFSMSESWEPLGKFPYPHPRDSERGEKWVEG